MFLNTAAMESELEETDKKQGGWVDMEGGGE